MHRARNHTPASFATTQVAGQKRLRNRDPVSCQPCRARKVACDREQPCNSCVKHKIPEKCSFNKVNESNAFDQSNDNTGPASFEPFHQTSTTQGAKTNKSTGLDLRLDRVEHAIELLTSRLNTSTSSAYPPASVQRRPDPADTQAKVNRDHEPNNPYAAGSLLTKDHDKVLYIGKSGWTMLHIDVRDLTFYDYT